jgi:hypothetical protein
VLVRKQPNWLLLPIKTTMTIQDDELPLDFDVDIVLPEG